MMRKNNQGVTLVELLVGIAIGSLVTIAATTVILLGLRLNRQSMDTAGKQNTARILLTAMEDLASDGSIKGIHLNHEDWQVIGQNENVIYSYDAENRVIYTGEGAAFMKDVLSSYLEYEDGLLTLSVETEKGIFNSTVYCRQAITPSGTSGSEEREEPSIPDKLPEVALTGVPSAGQRKAFLELLISQYRIQYDKDGNELSPSTKNYGVILDGTGKHTGQFYSEWYITSDGPNEAGKEMWDSSVWNPETPWCACYVTWGIAEAYKQGLTNYTESADRYRPVFAGVDTFMEYFKKDANDTNQWYDADYWTPNGETKYIPYPGDLIFYDWVFNEERDPQHVGVVLGTAKEEVNGKTVEYVYTIEGNVSDGTGPIGVVGMRKYRLDDPRILGYGVLDWKTDAEMPAPNPEN